MHEDGCKIYACLGLELIGCGASSIRRGTKNMKLKRMWFDNIYTPLPKKRRKKNIYIYIYICGIFQISSENEYLCCFGVFYFSCNCIMLIHCNDYGVYFNSFKFV